MRTQMDNNKLTIYLDGRIDSNNAGQAEQEMLSAVDAAPGCAVELDAENLEYISSAGLRILMKLRKKVKTSLPV